MIAGNQLVARTRQELDAFPMDYVAFPAAWTGEFVAEVLDLSQFMAPSCWRNSS